MSFSDSWSKNTSLDPCLERPRILITGCSSGIGYHAAKRLRETSCCVVASCRDPQDVARLRSEGHHCVQMDLDDSDSIDRGIRDALSITGGSLDVLINNAAYGQVGAVEDLTRNTLEKQFSTNVFGTHELTVKLMKTLLASADPRLVQISSVLGLVAMPYRGAYNASKFALEALTDTLRLEHQNTKLSISLIEPGPITSHFRQNAKKYFLQNIDYQHSRHIDAYKASLNRFDSDIPQPFTLSEEAVYRALHHAVFANKPKARYYVTKPTHLLGFLKRILSTRYLDKAILRIMRAEKNRFKTDTQNKDSSP